MLGDDVEVGSCSNIDRGALGDTVIGNDVKIDSQVQIAHNVKVGDHSALAGCSGIAGSTHVGQHCMLGGGAGLGLAIARRIAELHRGQLTLNARPDGQAGLCVSLWLYSYECRGQTTAPRRPSQ